MRSSFQACGICFHPFCLFKVIEFEEDNMTSTENPDTSEQIWKELLDEKDMMVQTLRKQLSDVARVKESSVLLCRCGGLENLLVSFCVDPCARQTRLALKESVTKALEEAQSIAAQESQLMERRAALANTVALIQKCQQALLKSTLHPVQPTTRHPATL